MVGAAPAIAGTWAFKPERDTFNPKALFDLRSLNEQVAGEHGFIRRSKNGADFVRGDGKPIRFWGLHSGAYRKHPKFPAPDLDRHARFIAKRGVNIVRFHGNVTPAGDDLMAIDENERDQLWRDVAAMKQQGIYTVFSPYWAVSSRLEPGKNGIPLPGEAKNHGLLFFNPTLQAAYKHWMKQVLTEKNPYTGIPLARDPALAIIELQNEDSLLFWTSQAIKNEAARELRRHFGKFLLAQYGTFEAMLQAWGGIILKEDDFANGEIGLYMIWTLTQESESEGQARRCADQMQFFTETMRAFNTMMVDYLKNTLGCKQLICAGNWRTADNVRMLDAERYSYTATDVIGVNRYYTGIHQGKHQGWAIINGDQFTDESVLLRPRHLPVTLKQVAGYPMIIPESSWVPPLGYQSEGPFLIAAYSSLNGVDAYFWFNTNEEDWRQPSSANGYLPSIGKWVCHTPQLLGQFPAAALMYRQGYIRQAKPVVYERRALPDLWHRRMPIIAEDPGYDPNRDAGDIAPESNIPGGVNPLAYLVGPVQVSYDDDPAKSRVAKLAPYINEAAQTVRSATGELLWDYRAGICTLDTPKAQGVTGFLAKRGAFELSDVTITSGNDYATVLVVTLDGRKLKRSRRVLVQVGTISRPTGWKTKPATIKLEGGSRPGKEVVDYGGPPWRIHEADVRIAISNRSLTSAHVLDVNGMSRRIIKLQPSGKTKTFVFPRDTLYVVLQ